MFAAMQRGFYGRTNLAAVIASMLANGRSVEQLRGGEIPDLLLDALAECLNKNKDNSDDAGRHSSQEKKEPDSL